MRTSTFKRNWMLHYIQPEFLYLPRREEEELPSCRISFVYNIYKRLDAYAAPLETFRNPLTGFLFKDNILIRDYLGNNRGSIFTLTEKGNYYFIPYPQYLGSFIPEKRKFKIRINKIKNAEILVYGIDMARTSFRFASEEGGTNILQEVRNCIAWNFQGDDEQGYTWWQIRMSDLLMAKCRNDRTGEIMEAKKQKRFFTGPVEQHWTSLEVEPTFYGDYHSERQVNPNYETYRGGSLPPNEEITCKTFYEDFSYYAPYFHYISYHYGDMYKSSDPPVYPIPYEGGGKHYLSTTFCCFEGAGEPPTPSDPTPSDDVRNHVWYHELFCDQRICHIPKIGGQFSLTDLPSAYKNVFISIDTIGTYQEIPNGGIITQGDGPYSLYFEIVLVNNAGQYIPAIETGIYRLTMGYQEPKMLQWLLDSGMPPTIVTNDQEGYTRTLTVDGRRMYDPLVVNYGKDPPQSEIPPQYQHWDYGRRYREHQPDIVRGSISRFLWDDRVDSGEVETIVPFIYNDVRQFHEDDNSFLRFESSNDVQLPYENVYYDDNDPLYMVFFCTACNHDNMHLQYVTQESAAREILETGEERILGEEYRAEGGVFVNGECIIYP